MHFLADSSIWAWANKPERPDIREKLADRFARGEVVSCVPVILEIMHGARRGDEYERTYEALFAPLDRLPLTDAIAARAVDVQRGMAHATDGNHRRPPHDFLIAAIAEAAPDVTLWAFDKDFDVIAEHTSQPYESERSTGSRRRSG